jgi:hypothetical protein
MRTGTSDKTRIRIQVAVLPTCGAKELPELGQALLVQLLVEGGEQVRLPVQVRLQQHQLQEPNHLLRGVVERDLTQVG